MSNVITVGRWVSSYRHVSDMSTGVTGSNQRVASQGYRVQTLFFSCTCVTTIAVPRAKGGGNDSDAKMEKGNRLSTCL